MKILKDGELDQVTGGKGREDEWKTPPMRDPGDKKGKQETEQQQEESTFSFQIYRDPAQK